MLVFPSGCYAPVRDQEIQAVPDIGISGVLWPHSPHDQPDIVSTSELLSRLAQDSPYSATTDRIVRSGMRMSKLLDDLRDYSRTLFGLGIRITRRECDLRKEIDQEVVLLRETLADVPVRFHAVGHSEGRFDASRIREALSHLVTNAAKYGKGGTEILVCLVADTEHVDLIVENTGEPIDPMLLEVMFEPLKRGQSVALRGEHSSLGLGLFIVREVARAHGGELKALSAHEFIMSRERER